MRSTAEERAHKEWLGYVQPTGLVVSIPALLDAQCQLNSYNIEEHRRFLSCLQIDENQEIVPEIQDLPQFLQRVFDWREGDIVPISKTDALQGDQQSLEVILHQYQETLRPSFAVPAFKPAENESHWMMLIQEVDSNTNLDEFKETDTAQQWQATPQSRLERLLRETGVPIGLLSNRQQLRLVYAPRGESSGYATFKMSEMVQVDGRPIFAALNMLFEEPRMFSMAPEQKLPAILENSRKYQNTVSTELADQVLAALYELMRGFQAANDAAKGELLREPLEKEPNHVYSGLLTVLMRLVFVLYAEDRDLLSSDPVYSNNYSVNGLFDRLREDAGLYPDTMHQRYGAWSQLITLFQLIHFGGKHSELNIPRRRGYLFDPSRYPFLEGKQRIESDSGVDCGTPQISDGVIFNALKNLLILNGERLSYRALDVEQIGSVYEAVMGFDLQIAEGCSIAIKPLKRSGAPSTINLESLLGTPGKDRAKWLKDNSDQKLGTGDLKLLKSASSINALLEALDNKIAKYITPATVPKGAVVLQPSDERRRSGSHYTPRSLTEPIVRITLEPILKQLVEAEMPEPWQPDSADKKRYTPAQQQARIERSERNITYVEAAKEIKSPHPQQILDLRLCDPAMGSGAFLVEACRQLGDELITAWYKHNMVPKDIPPDEDEVLYARRLVAQRCLYGVDKNLMAVDLAKLSLWLVTLAKDQAFTFLDHSLRHGDSLVGLTREQIIGFHWDVKKQKKFGEDLIQKRLDRATEARAKILNAHEDAPYKDQEQRLAVADEALDMIRILGDACVSCFFSESKKKAREEEVDRVYGLAQVWLKSFRTDKVDVESQHRVYQAAARLRDSSQEHPVPAFHWEIEFPEVFSRENGGFDAFVGNPPFAGKNTLLKSSRDGYIGWLKGLHVESHGNSDLVAHFFRRTFNCLRANGCLGLIATNTIRQGDTRTTGLRWIRVKGNGTIFCARRRLVWPGQAAVVVSVVYINKSINNLNRILDGREVDDITAYLFHSGPDEDASLLLESQDRCFVGVQVHGLGLTFDDLSIEKGSNALAERDEYLKKKHNQDIIKPLMGWEEITNSPTYEPRRSVIDFSEFDEECARAWPELFSIVEQKVKPGRMTDNRTSYRNYWWQFAEKRPKLTRLKKTVNSVIVCSAKATTHLSFAILPSEIVFTNATNVVVDGTPQRFCCLQSRPHEVWARFFGSSMKDDLTYTNSSCFETFPFPVNLNDDSLVSYGVKYAEYRLLHMKKCNEGLTDTYNRFHSPEERDEGILELRRLHGLMDEAVLRAYGWDDLADSASKSDFCEFLLDYEEEEDNDSLTTKKKSKKKKPWRYRWPDDFRDEVLARLLELNEKRYLEEQKA